MISKDTQMCISLASFPSNFGTTLHNSLYKILGVDFIYKACRTDDIAQAISGVRGLNIRGCSVSMPYKEVVMDYLDSLDDIAQQVGAVNTVVNESGHLKGYNTDITGALESLKTLRISKNETIWIVGAGGVSKAILYALRNNGFTNIYVSNRDSSRLNNLAKIADFKVIDWATKSDFRADVLINATPIGTDPSSNETPFAMDAVSESRAVMDVVVSPIETHFIKSARSLGKETAPGYLMSMEQARAQFQLYTGIEVTRSLVTNEVLMLLKGI